MTELNNIIATLQKAQGPKLLAVLVRLFGAHNLALAEDVLQDAFYKALVDWQISGVPDNPPAWLIKTAKHCALDQIRKRQTQSKYAQDLSHFLQSDWTASTTLDKAFTQERIRDDQLRMLFMCCHKDLSPDNRLPFMLKNLCGLTIEAISQALLINVSTVKKRLVRTKEKLQQYQFVIPAEDELTAALDSVHTALYLLFNEGFYSTSKKVCVDIMLCKEALGLTDLLIEEQGISNRDSYGLLALMHFHMARASSKLDECGNPIPLNLQDRSQWDKTELFKGCGYLAIADKTARIGTGRFLLEAKIAQQHSLSSAFSATPWRIILSLYQQLLSVTQSPVTQLNLAVAQAYSGDVDGAIELVKTLQRHAVFAHSHLPLATLAHLHALQGDKQRALDYAVASNTLGGSDHQKVIMMSQIEDLLAKTN